MTGQGWFEVGVHGPPDPDEHPWVMWRDSRLWSPRWRLRDNTVEYVGGWLSGDQWFPVSAPPTEPAPTPEPEWVEVDGQKYALRCGRLVMEHRASVATVEHGAAIMPAAMLTRYARIAAALGLVDESPVPQSLIDWLRKRANRGRTIAGTPPYAIAVTDLLGMIEAGEFGPVEVRWVTDRLPDDDEYPVLWDHRSEWGQAVYAGRLQDGPHDVVLPEMVADSPGWRWVSLSDLLGDR